MPTTNLQLPHLVSFCQGFELRTSRHCRAAAVASKKWAQEGKFLDEAEQVALPGLQLGLLASLCYPTCDVAQLSLITQFLVLLLHWIDRAPTSAEAAFDHIWARLLRTSSPDWQARFQHHMCAFRTARALVARDNAQSVIPDMESYVALRQDSSGVKLLFDLIEYAEGLRIPNGVYSAPALHQLRRDACNIIAWSWDIASFAQQHATSDKHNIVTVLISERRLPIQSAMQAAGALVKQTVATFLANEHALVSGSTGKSADADVKRYVQGLRDWIVGSTHWLYETDRFFGGSNHDVRDLGWVFLSPR